MTFRVARAIGAILLSLSITVVHAATVIHLDGDPGDPINAGQASTLTPPASTITVDVAADSTISVDASSSAGIAYSLHFRFTPRPGTVLVGPAHVMPLNPRGTEFPVINVSSNGQPCYTDEGVFVVYEMVGTPGAVTQLAVDFVQRCINAGGVLRGQIRFNSNVPLTQATPRAVIDAPDYADQGEFVRLDGRWSMPGPSALSTYAWQQLGGPAVTISGANTATPTFVATAAPGSTSPLVFSLKVTDVQGNTNTTQHTVNVYSSTTPRTVIAFQSDSGEYVFAGHSYMYRDTDTAISAVFNGSNVFNALQINSEVTLLLTSPALALNKGNYLNARAISDGFSPGLDVFGFARGCNGSLGQFTIFEISYDSATHNLLKLALDFDRHCTSNPDSPARAYGQIRINSAVPLVHLAPNAIAGNAQEVSEQSLVKLDGSNSRPGKNPIATYAWKQIAGPTVAMSSISSATPTFSAPAVGTGSVQLAFALTVADAYGNSSTDQTIVTVVSASIARNVLKIDSSGADDWIGQGEHVILDENNSLITVTRASSQSVTLDAVAGSYGLGMTFSAPAGETLRADNYEGAQRADLSAPVRPGLVIASAAGRACNALTGRFVIREIAFDGSGTLARLAADARQHCDGGPPLDIALRYHSSIPATVEEPTAAAGTDQGVLERSTVTLDGRNTMPGTSGITTWQWKQVAGPSVALSNATTSVATFTAPKASTTETLTFDLAVSGSNGATSHDRTDVHVYKKTAPRSFAYLDSAVGDWVGGGQGTYILSPADGLFYSQSQVPDGDAIHLNYNGGPETWDFEIASTGNPLQLGTYAVDATSSVQMRIGHSGAGCNQTRGSFTIYDIAFSKGTLQRLALDFLQYCDGSSGPLQGQVRFNSSLPDANAGGDQSVSAGEKVTLSAAASVAAVGTLQKYSWQQLSGPTASVSDSNTATPTITAPSLPQGSSSANLVFELTVTDQRGLSDADRVTLTVQPGAAPPSPAKPGGSGGGGTISLFELLAGICLLRVTVRRRRACPGHDFIAPE